jgi:uncharacterized damage-inducible protein DinB
MDPEIQNIVSLLERTFEKNAWHGPAVKEVLAGLSAEEAFHRLPNTHSIIELVAHMTAWRRYLINSLSGDFSYKVTDDLNFPNANDWNMTLEELIDSQQQLIAALKALPSEKLSIQVPWTEQSFTYYTIIHGLIHHDLYHAGQIILIRKATAQQSL